MDPEPAAALDRLPLPSLILAAGRSAIAANQAWAGLSGMSRDDSRGDGWLRAVEPLDRDGLRSRLRDAAGSATGGSADWRLTSPRGRRWSRWWWAPDAAGGLVACIADIDDDKDAPGPLPLPVPRANGGHGPAVRDGDAVTELAVLAVRRISGVAMTLAAAMSLTEGEAAARVGRAADQLDDLIREIRLEAFEPTGQPRAPLPGTGGPEPAGDVMSSSPAATSRATSASFRFR